MIKKISIILLTLFFISCNQKVRVLSDFNTIGIVKKKRETKNYESGNYIYKIWIDPETKVWIITNERFGVGDTVWLKSRINCIRFTY